jgi:DNA-directed RNA polymerase specialized sigma24 family protein
VPPNWTSTEWKEEIRAESFCAFWRACHDFEPSRHVPFDAFAWQRVLAAALTRYRQEWTFALHCEGGDLVGDGLHGGPNPFDDSECLHVIREALAHLSSSQTTLINALFWDGDTEAAIANRLAMTQQAVSKRKRAALRDLRKLLTTRGSRA